MNPITHSAAWIPAVLLTLCISVTAQAGSSPTTTPVRGNMPFLSAPSNGMAGAVESTGFCIDFMDNFSCPPSQRN